MELNADIQSKVDALGQTFGNELFSFLKGKIQDQFESQGVEIENEVVPIAAQAPEQSTFQRYMPFIIGGGLILGVLILKKAKALRV